MNSPEKSHQIHRAVKILKSGGLVAFPTETVFGLAARACDMSAIHKLYEAKGRSLKKPLTIQVSDTSMLPILFDLSEVEQNLLNRLTAQYWPGPLTIVAPKSKSVSTAITGGLSKIGVRIPNHPTALEILKLMKEPLAVSSVNRTGTPAINDPHQIKAEWGSIIDLLIEDAHPNTGCASTVVDISGGGIKILRSGEIDLQNIPSPQTTK